MSKRMVPAHELSTMKKVRQEIRPFGPARMLTKSAYARVLRPLQIELVKLQKHLIRCNDKLVVVLEGRDASGKDGVIKTMVRHLSPRETRVVALGKPSDRERSAWYFQRYAVHLPAGQEFVLFNRSWYNRAGVERVMKFCSDHEYEEFMRSVLDFERMLISSGIRLFKYYLDITRREQRRRLKERAADPLKQWKVSPIDAEALERWHDYSEARDEMFKRTHDPSTPWTIVRADDKRVARLNLIRDLLSRLQYCDKDDSVLSVDPAVVFRYEPDGPDAGAIAH